MKDALFAIYFNGYRIGVVRATFAYAMSLGNYKDYYVHRIAA